MKQKVAQKVNSNYDDAPEDEDNFQEYSKKNVAALAHQQYNTDQIMNAGVSDKKQK